MTAKVQRIAAEVSALAEPEMEEFLAWLADYGLRQADPWDEEIGEDSQPGGRLTDLVRRAREDIAQGRTQPLDEVLDDL